MTLTGTKREYEDTMHLSAEQSSALSACFGSVGFDADALKTSSFNISSEYENRRDSEGNYERIFIGYRFRQQLWVEFDADNALLGRVLSAVAECSAVPEFSINYTVRDREAASLELLDRAVCDSKNKAERLAKAAGMKGMLVAADIVAGGDEPDMTVRPLGGMMLAKCANDCACPDITPENVEISDTVTVIWKVVG